MSLILPRCAALLLLTVSATCASTTSSPLPSNLTSSCANSLNGILPTATPSDFEFSGNTRRYYIAAEEIEWDYAPTGWDNWLGVPIDVSPRAQAVTSGMGTKYLKALYRGYTDSSFTQLSEQPPWQGSQGPTIRSEVGDLVEILFVNKLSKNYATMHSMGLAYNKANEGADYPNGTVPNVNYTVNIGNAVPPLEVGVPPGSCAVYKWLVNNASGPNDGLPARTHSYHSYVDLDVDVNSGLVGPHIVYASGRMHSTMANYREFPLLYMVYNEAHSFLSAQNARKLTSNHSADSVTEWGVIDTETLYSGNYSIWHPQVVNLNSSGQFHAAASFHSLNGYVFSNNPTYEMCENDKVIWYVNAFGAASHAFHMHGNGFRDAGRKQYAVDMQDGIGKTLYMDAVDIGLWQLVCHVSNHHQDGMVSKYRVYPAGSCPVKLPKELPN